MSEISFFGKQLKLNKEEDAADVVKAIEEAVDMETLTLSGNTCGVEACKAIGAALSTKPTFKRAIWRDIFTGRLLDEIPPSLNHLGDGVIVSSAKLTELDLSDNAFGPNGIKGAVNLLSSPACFSLKILTLNNVGLGIGGAKLLATSLLNCHQAAAEVGDKFALEEFTSGRNRLENEGAKAMAEVFETLGTLVHVSMTQNGINHPGITALARALAKNPNMEVLDLNDNTFTVKGAAAVAEAFPMLNKLKKINFGDCLLRAEGAKVIATAVQDHLPNLEELDLSFNEVDGEAALAIGTALANKTMIKKVELNGNCIGETNIELLRQSLEAKGHMDVLGNLSDDEGDDDDEDDGGSGSEEEDEEQDDDKETKPSEEAPADGVKEDSVHEATAKSPQPSPGVSVDTYWNNPTIDNLWLLPAGERTNLVATKVLECKTPDMMEFGRHFVRIAACCKMKEDQAAKTAVLQVLETSFKAHMTSDFMSAFLQHVGLLKNEDKTFQPTTDIEGPIVAMMHLAKEKILSEEQIDMLKLFIFKEDSLIHQQQLLKQYVQENIGAV